MGVLIARYINDISINGLEYLLGENGKAKEFKDKNEALLFLKDQGLVDKDIGHFMYKEVEPDKARAAKKRTKRESGEDRGR